MTAVRRACFFVCLWAGCSSAQLREIDAGSVGEAGLDASPQRDASGADAADASSTEDASPDAGSDGGPCPTPVSDGRCGTLLFADDFEDGVIDDDWSLWRKSFVESGGVINGLAEPRPGFFYGHDGHGRAGVLVTHAGELTWTDYRLEARVRAFPPDPAYNPAGIADCDRAIGIAVRVARASESWNEPAETLYYVHVSTASCGGAEAGSWVLLRYNDRYFEGTGCCAGMRGSLQTISMGTGAPAIDGWNDLAVEVEGTRIRLWLQDELVFDVSDESALAVRYGGIALLGHWENPFAVDAVRVIAID